MPTKPRRLNTTRDHRVRDVLRLLVTLRRGRWTVEDIAAELGLRWRATYRLLATLRAVGVTLEVSREREHPRGTATPLYSVPAEPLRKLLRL